MTQTEFVLFVQEVQGPLRRFLRLLCHGDAFTADDLAQDACLKAWLARDSFQGKSKFSTWIFQIAYHCFCDKHYYNNMKVNDLSSEEVMNFRETDLLEDQYKYQNLHAAIKALGEKEQTAILLYFLNSAAL